MAEREEERLRLSPRRLAGPRPAEFRVDFGAPLLPEPVWNAS